MSVQLEISDGQPWWLSPDIWIVPGNDPTGSPGIPTAGNQCYLWARVHNNGNSAVSNATVRFYWANPSVGFDRTTASPVGTSFVSLDAGESQDVLCLSPWVPVYVNDGHECVLAEAFHTSQDPLPLTPSFNVPTDRHVAQRNLSVVRVAVNMFRLSFEVHNPSRKTQEYRIVAKQDSLKMITEQNPWIIKTFKLPQNEIKISKMLFTREHCSTIDAKSFKDQEPNINLKVGPFSREGLSIIGNVEEKGAAIVHIEQLFNKELVGGLSTIIIVGNGGLK